MRIQSSLRGHHYELFVSGERKLEGKQGANVCLAQLDLISYIQRPTIG